MKKVKAITFKQNGNDLKESYFNVTQYTENVFLSPDLDNTYSESSFVIIHQNGIYANLGSHSNQHLTDENKEYLENVPLNFVSVTLQNKWINKLEIEFAKQAGLDYQSLINRRLEIEKEREQRKIRRLEAEKLEQQEQQQAEKEKAESILTLIKQGDKVTFNQLIFVVDYFKVSVHPRTKGAINNQNSGSEISLTTGRFTNKTSSKTAQSIFDLIKKVSAL